MIMTELTREDAIQLHRANITGAMHFTPTNGITHCCSRDLIGDGPRQTSLENWAKAPNITGCPFCHRTWCD